MRIIQTILMGILLFNIIIILNSIYFLITGSRIDEPFTEFYILNDTGVADGYPNQLKLNNNTSVILGISNHESKLINYTIEIVLDKDILFNKKLSLKNGQTWEENVSFKPNKVGNDLNLNFWLFKDNNLTQPYRKLNLWLKVT